MGGWEKVDEKQLDGIEKRILCARFYDCIKVFYENPANQQRFENWQKERKNRDDLPSTNLIMNDKETAIRQIIDERNKVS